MPCRSGESDQYSPFGKREKGEWEIIFDNLLDDPNNIFDFSSEVSEEVDEYVRNSHNIIVSLKLKNGKYSCGEIGLPMTNSKLVLPCGIFAKWEQV